MRGPRESATLRRIAMWNTVFRNIYTYKVVSLHLLFDIYYVEETEVYRGACYIDLLDEEIRIGLVGFASFTFLFLIKFQANDF